MTRAKPSVGSMTMRSSLGLAALLGLLAFPWVTLEAAQDPPSLLVTSQGDHSVKEYDGTTGAFVRTVAYGLGDPLDAVIGPDGNLLVTDGQQSAIRRFNWSTGLLMDTLATPVNPEGMTVFRDRVYVCQSNSPQIVRSFDALTGEDTGSFLPTVGSGNPAPRDVKVANGRLYVAYNNLATIEMFDLTTRASLGLLLPLGTDSPSAIAFGPDGKLYTASGFAVNRYDAMTGAFLGQFVDMGDTTGHRRAIGIAWGPDNNLYVSTQIDAGVQRFNGITGAFMDDFVPVGSGGLTAPFHISFTPFAPPLDCSSAHPSLRELWPPDHRLVPVAIEGVVSPDASDVTITVTEVSQDEALGDGIEATCPDGGGVGTPTASLRAERAGYGDGRVYKVSFTAQTASGGACSGTVEVCVPHDRGHRGCGHQKTTVSSTGPCRAPARL